MKKEGDRKEDEEQKELKKKKITNRIIHVIVEKGD